MNDIEGQLVLFPLEKKEPKKTKEKATDPNQTFAERMNRFWHYMETKGMNEQWIETAPGELRIIIDALADYYDIAIAKTEEMNGYAKAVWENRLNRIKQIQTKLEGSIGYSRDKQLEICAKRKSKKEDDIGEDALVMAMKKGVSQEKNEEKRGGSK